MKFFRGFFLHKEIKDEDGYIVEHEGVTQKCINLDNVEWFEESGTNCFDYGNTNWEEIDTVLDFKLKGESDLLRLYSRVSLEEILDCKNVNKF